MLSCGLPSRHPPLRPKEFATIVSMPDSPFPADAVFQVSEFLDLLNTMFKPLRATVQGEITSLKVRGGHTYFSVTDPQDQAKLECIVWKFRAAKLDFKLEEGMAVQMVGAPNIYKPFGKLSFIADYVSPVGEGALRQAFEKLKQRLEQSGYFDPDRKQSLPRYPQNIGLITSAQGDAIKDFRTHLGEFGYRLQHYDVRVEGVNAIDSIVEAIKWFNAQPPSQAVEVVVLTRGGGSLESLQAFNSEPVAQAIFASKIPILSAIGHENDVTISDLVADRRGSTPTDAGKILSQYWREADGLLEQTQERLVERWYASWQELAQRVRYHEFHLLSRWERWCQSLLHQLEQYEQGYGKFITQVRHHLSTKESDWQQQQRWWWRQWQQQQRDLTKYSQDLPLIFERWQRQWQQRLDQVDAQLKLSDPQLKLKQGFSIARLKNGTVVRSATQVNAGDAIDIQVHQGLINTTVQKGTHEQ